MGRSRLLMVVGTICFMLALIISPLAAGSFQAEEPKTIRFGVLAQLTGWLATFSTMNVNEAKIVTDMLNEKGGITVGGQQYKIELVVEDGKSTLDGNIAAANKLIFDHGVKFILGPDGFFGSAVKGICEQNKIMHILAWCTMQPGEMDASTKWAFLGQNTGLESFIAGVTFMKEKYPDVKKVALVMPDDGSIPYAGKVNKKILEDNGYTVVGRIISFDNSAIDFNPIAARVAATGAGAMIGNNGLVLAWGSIIKGLRELGCNMLVGLSSGMDPYNIVAVAGPKTSNVFNVGAYADVPQKSPLLEEVTNRIVAKMGKDVPISCQFGNAIYEYKQVFEKAQSFDPDVVRNTLEKMATIDTFWGSGKLGGLKSYGIKHGISHPVPVTTIENGKVVFQEWVTFVVP